MEEVEIPFLKIRLTVNIATDGNDDALERAKADLQKYCPLAKVIRNSGTQIEEVWNVTKS